MHHLYKYKLKRNKMNNKYKLCNISKKVKFCESSYFFITNEVNLRIAHKFNSFQKENR